MRRKAFFITFVLIACATTASAVQGPFTIVRQANISSEDVDACDPAAQASSGHYIFSQATRSCLEKTNDLGPDTFYEVGSASASLCKEHTYTIGNRLFVKAVYLGNYISCKIFTDAKKGKKVNPHQDGVVKSMAYAEGVTAAANCFPISNKTFCREPYDTEACLDGFKDGYSAGARGRDGKLRTIYSNAVLFRGTSGYDCFSVVPEGSCRSCEIKACQQGLQGSPYVNTCSDGEQDK